MKKSGLFYLFILCICLCFPSCKSDMEQQKEKEQEENDILTPYGKYKDTMVYTLGKIVPNSPRLPENEDYENNAYTKYLLETLNIQNENKFEAIKGEFYDQKALTAMTTGELPDIMCVNEEMLKKLVESDLIADLTTVYDLCTTDRIKDMYQSYGTEVIEKATFDGKLMAMPSTVCDNNPSFLWIRKDWLDQLSLPVPASLQDLEMVLTQFVQKDPGRNGEGNTIGLVVSREIGGNYGELFQSDVILSCFGAFVGKWMERDGQIIYSSITNEMKEALFFLSEWYEKGILDSLIGVRVDISTVILNGQCGTFFGPWWAPDHPLNEMVKQNSNADWIPLIISKDGDGVVLSYTQNPVENYWVVRKEFEHPEILPKIVSVFCDKLVYEDNHYPPIVEYLKMNVDSSVKPVDILVNYRTATKDMYKEIRESLDGKRDSELLNINDYSNYLKCKEYLKDPLLAGADNWSGYTSRIVAAELLYYTEIIEVKPVFFGQTESMNLFKSELERMEKEAFLKIIMGVEEIDYFEEFRQEWLESGGAVILEEVREESGS